MGLHGRYTIPDSGHKEGVQLKTGRSIKHPTSQVKSGRMPRRHSHLPRSALFDRVGHLQLPTEQLVANMGSGFRVLRLFAFSVWSLGSRV